MTKAVGDKTGAPPEIMVKNIADFERQYATYDVATNLKDAFDFDADLVIVAIKPQHCRRFGTRQKVADARQRVLWRMQHDVLAFANLQHAVESLQDLVDEGLSLGAERFLGLDDDGFSVEQHFELAQAVGGQRAARGDKVADVLGAAEFGRYLDGSGKEHWLRMDRVLLKKLS